jgi:hypothetical protein
MRLLWKSQKALRSFLNSKYYTELKSKEYVVDIFRGNKAKEITAKDTHDPRTDVGPPMALVIAITSCHLVRSSDRKPVQSQI